MLPVHANGTVDLVKIGTPHALMEQPLPFVTILTIVIGTRAILVLASQLVLITPQTTAQEANGVQHLQDLVQPTLLLHAHHSQLLPHALDMIQKQQDVLGLTITHANQWEQ